jgi:DNA-binding FrmR family transcriptional regulator
MMNEDTQRKVLSRLRRIAGQVEGIARMVEGNRYCMDLLLQIASAQAALGQVSKLILRSHVETCVSEVLASGKSSERKQKIDELLELFARYGCLGSRPAVRGSRARA